MKTTKKLNQWWNQFPSKLRRITICRVLASTGAGGVLYLTPLVFNNLSFSAIEIGLGFCLASITGTISRLATGIWIDKGIRFEIPLKVCAVLAIIADFLLFTAYTKNNFLVGELFLGAAAGIYWPSVEIAIPISCEEGNSSKGFALARTADALGVSIGVLIGSISAGIGNIRSIYIVEMLCMCALIILLNKTELKNNSLNLKNNAVQKAQGKAIYSLKKTINLLRILTPLIIISLLGTGILCLMQIGIQLDLVKGGIIRPEVSSSFVGLIVAYKLILLLLIQWPIGKWLSQKNVKTGLKLSNINFTIGCLILSISSFYSSGIILIIIGLIPISIGIAMFLPTATEAIVRVAPKEQRGLAMAIYSQCFGVSFLIFPLIAGGMIDSQGNAMMLWLTTAFLSLLVSPLTKQIRPVN